MARESELSREESELGAVESRLADQVQRATQEASTLASRLTQVRAELARTQSEHTTDVTLPEIGARLQAAAIPELAVEAAREKALTARQEALEARRQASQEMTIALHAFQQQTTALTRELAEAEKRLKEVTEAAARARREQETARSRKAQQSREAPRATAPATRAPATAAPTATRRERGPVHMHTNISLGSDSNFFTGFSTDISSGGIFVATVDTVPQGTPVERGLHPARRPAAEGPRRGALAARAQQQHARADARRGRAVPGAAARGGFADLRLRAPARAVLLPGLTGGPERAARPFAQLTPMLRMRLLSSEVK